MTPEESKKFFEDVLMHLGGSETGTRGLAILAHDTVRRKLMALRSAIRLEALEEAAKVADITDYWEAPDDGEQRAFIKMNNRGHKTPERIAAAIRALKDKGE